MQRANNVRKTVEGGDTVFGARARTNSPILVDVYGEMGYDFVFIDTEHTGNSPLDSPKLQQFARAADVAETEILVRVASGDPVIVRKVLDAGIRNLAVPRVETADDVRDAIKAACFIYDDEPGERGVGGSYPNTWGATYSDYPAQQDETVFVGVIIENQTAIANIEEILAVPNLGCVFLGAADLSVSLGRPLDTDHPDVQEALDKVWAAARAADIPVGVFTSSSSATTDALERGAQLVQLGNELTATREVLGQRLEEASSK